VALDSFNSGTYQFETTEDTFDPVAYTKFLDDIAEEISTFKVRQAVALEREKELEAKLFSEWDKARTEAEKAGAPKLSLDGKHHALGDASWRTIAKECMLSQTRRSSRSFLP
jgi:hypothetical protein